MKPKRLRSHLLGPSWKHFAAKRRVARLATSTSRGKPYLVPICFAFDGRSFFSVVDEKPKKRSPLRLRRVRNIQANPQVALLLDEYYEDWRKLRFVLVQGKATILLSGVEHDRAVRLLRRKYGQYRKMRIEGRPVILVKPTRVTVWGR